MTYDMTHLHVHTDLSGNDGALTTQQMFVTAKERGCKAVAITEHGNMMSTQDARKYAKITGVKYIPGVEAYFENETDTVIKRKHLLLLAKNLDGYRAIHLAVTASNANLDSKGFPIMNAEILNKYFTKGTIGHGNVIATSACVGGILASVLNSNEDILKEKNKLQDKINGLYNPASPVYQDALTRYNEIDEELKTLADEIKATEKLAKRPFTAKEKSLRSFEGKPEYAEKKALFDAEKAESEEAAKTLVTLKNKRTSLKLEQGQLNDTKKLFEGSNMARFEAFTQRIVELDASIKDEDTLFEEAKKEAIKFVEMFGRGNFFIEVQNHNIDTERVIMPKLVKLARELSIPLVATNDIHILDNSPKSIKSRQLIRSLRFNKWEELQQGDTELYFKSDEEMEEILGEILPADAVKEAMANTNIIADMCNVEFKDEPHYPKFISDDGEDAVTRLRRLSTEGIAWRFPNGGWNKTYEDRMNYELGIIEKLGFCDYLCIVEDFLTYGRLLGKIDLNNEEYLNDPYNMELLKKLAEKETGLGIGPGRGSAVGSLVCYLIGITSIDPMQYNLLFERFLNPERVSMPDIDSDFKRDIRGKVLDYVKFKYGEDAVCCIMTRGTRAVKGSIRDAARLLGSEKENDTTKYLSLGDAISKKVPSKPDIKFSDVEENLLKEFSSNKSALEIIANAKLLSGTFANVGMHAAGVIIADNGDVKQYLPLMWNEEKEQWMTQIEKDYCESIGLLKMDVRLVR